MLTIIFKYTFPIIFLFSQCSGVVYRLNDTEYYKMPPVFHLDPYDTCLRETGGVYCTVDFTLVSDMPSHLLTMIREFSEFTPKHFNHTQLTYGICVKKTCDFFYTNTTADLGTTLEACLNESMWDMYELKTKISDQIYCNGREEIIEINTGDIIVVAVFIIVILLNVVGSLYEFHFTKGNNEDGNKFLLCFAIRRNWRKLMAPAADGPERRLKLLIGINAVKAIAMLLVIIAHSMIASIYCLDNPRELEGLYDLWPYHILVNGTTIVQAFLVVSGFLLVYNLQLHAEIHKLNWTLLPKGILLRWLRLTPSYALVLAYVSTWHRFIGSGPFWKKVAVAEVLDCRRQWWLHLLYISNYAEGSNCMNHTWYLSTDTQLYILGIIICIACRSSRSRMVVLSLLLLIGLLIPAAITYYKDLDGILVASPEANRHMYMKDPTYTHVYARGYTNIASYVIGLGFGYMVYYAQKYGFDAQKYKSYLWLYWSTLPAGFGLIISGMVFYSEGPRASMYLRIATASLLKPVFGLLIACSIAASAFKYENVYRNFMEWPGWTLPARLTYSAYLLHYTLVKYIIGVQVTVQHLLMFHVVLQFLGTICLSFLGAGVLWLFIETPIGQLVKTYLLSFGKPEPDEREKCDGNAVQ